MSNVLVSKPILILSAIFAVLAMVAIGLGVYFGTKGTDCPSMNMMGSTEALVKTSTVSLTTTTTSRDNIPTTTTTKPKTTAKPLDPSAYRLPTSLIPIEYRLTLQPYLNVSHNFTFDGYVEIDFTCENATNRIVINANKINFNNATLINGTTRLLLKDLQIDNQTQKVTFPIPTNLQQWHNYTIAIYYTGELGDDLAGFYRGKYVENNETKYMAMTQFEPEDARRAFPCFDEPSFKAVFNLTIIHPVGMVAIANTMEISTEAHGDDWLVTKFKPSLKMSTYLVAFAVADFVNQTRISNTTKNTIFRIWSRPSLFSQTDYAANAGPKVLEYYEKNFNVEFPLEKQDMLAAPEFSAGAMENWGLVTYREYDLLYDNISYGPANKENVALVIAHELAHQWFGDLVTLAWWDDTWLNEGFAAYNEYDGADHIDPTFQYQKSFVVTEIQGTMQVDQLNTSHPIYMPELKTADEINANFDTITYDKGASMIYMLRNTITMDTFLSGLNTYLLRHQEGNAVHEDLWTALTEAVSNAKPVILDWNNKTLNVSALMDPWILQTGFPVVSVARSANSLTLTQKRFLLVANETVSHQQTWPIPISLRKADGTVEMKWLQGTNSLTIPLSKANDFVLLNYNVNGFYRVDYDDASWKQVVDTLTNNHLSFPADNRAQFIDDSMNLARAKYHTYDLPLNMLCYLNGRETEESPWAAALSNLDYIDTMLQSNGDSHIAMNKFTKSLLKNLYDNLTWTEESETDFHRSSLRAQVLSTMCEQVKYPDCTKTAARLFADYYQTCKDHSANTGCVNPIHPNLRATVYCAGVSVADSEVWQNLWEKYKVEPVANERQNIMRGLACSTDVSLLTKLLNEVLDGTYIAAMDLKSVLRSMSVNQISNLLIWDFIESNWERIRDRFTHGYLSFGSLVVAATTSFNTEQSLAKVKSFANAHSDELGTGKSAFDNAIESIQANINWVKGNADYITKWLQTHQC